MNLKTNGFTTTGCQVIKALHVPEIKGLQKLKVNTWRF